MRGSSCPLLLASALASALAAQDEAAAPAAPAATRPPLQFVRAIALPGVRGRIDHLACDPQASRLYVAAIGNGSLEVVDLARGVRVASVAGLAEPQGTAFLPAAGRVAVACGGDGRVLAFDAATLAPAGALAAGSDADNVRPADGGAAVFVGSGAGGGGELCRIDARSWRLAGRVPLPGHPESFQLEPGGTRAFVNVPAARAVVVVDVAAGKVAATWPLPAAARNFPLALDAAHRRLFVGCRSPACVLVLDAGTGKVQGQCACVDDADDLFVDDEGRVLVIGGGGAVDVLAERGQGFERVASVPTAAGARTGLWVEAGRRLFVAVPARGGQGAEIREFARRD